jgi:hypothetical protein
MQMHSLLTMRFLIMAAQFGGVIYGDADVTLPLGDGSILIRAQFIQQRYGNYVPELALKIMNQTSSPWRAIKLQFDIGALCNGETRQWTLPVSTSLGLNEDHHLVKEYTDTVISLVGKVDGCKTEIIKARLLLAENLRIHVDQATGERTVVSGDSFTFPDVPVDLSSQLQEIKTKHETEAAAHAEAERNADEVERKANEGEAARRKRLAAQQKRKQAEADARYAKMKAEENAKASEEQRRVRAACTVVYQSTIDKKVKDLTVREEQQVRSCQTLGLYLPQ